MGKDTPFKCTAILRDYKTAFKYIVLLGFTLRVLWALLISVEPISDSFAYATFARNIAEFGVYGWIPEQPGAFWPVGTAAIYALFFYVFGDSYVPITLFNILIGTAIIVLAMRISHRLFGAQVASLTGFILAIWPSLIFYVTVLASELPFIFLILAAIDFWCNPNYARPRSAIFSGICIAGACYIRPVALLLPFVFGFTFAIQSKQWRVEINKVIVTCLSMVILILPWSIRNYQVFGHVVIISTNGPVTLWMGNHPDTDGAYASTPDWAKSLNEYDRAQIMGDRAYAHIKADPLGFVTRSVNKLIQQHSYETIAVTWNGKGIENSLGKSAILPLKAICQGYWLLILFLSLVGLFLIIKNMGIFGALFHPVVLPWLYFSAIHAIIVAQDRYHFPAIPFISILAAYALSILINRYSEQFHSI